MPESEEYGVTSFVFKSDRPFHPKRLQELINSTGEVRTSSHCVVCVCINVCVCCAAHLSCDAQMQHLIRSKGFVWLATRPRNCGVWGHAGNIFTIDKVQTVTTHKKTHTYTTCKDVRSLIYAGARVVCDDGA